MSRSLLRGLSLLEHVGTGDGIGVSDLARRVGLDKSVVSRMVAGCEAEGWLIRSEGRVQLGPRAAVLGQRSPQRATVRRAEELCHAVAGVTGLTTLVPQVAGGLAYMLAVADGREHLYDVPSVGEPLPLWATAMGKALGAQIDPAELVELLPPEPMPRFTPATIVDHATYLAAVKRVRSGERALDRGEFHAGVACVALPWRTDGLALPAVMACLGPIQEIDTRELEVVRILRAAVAPGATRRSIAAAAADDQVTPT